MAKRNSGSNFTRILSIIIVSIVIVVLVVLFFTPNNQNNEGAECVPTSSNFICVTASYYNSNGTVINLGFRYTNATNVTLYNVQMTCTNSITISGGPTPNDTFEYLSQESATTLVQSNQSGFFWLPGQRYFISGMKCYGRNGLLVATPGTYVTAYIWINYTTKNESANTMDNPWVTKEIAVTIDYVS